MKYPLLSVALMSLWATGYASRAELAISQEAYIKASNTGNADDFGYSLAISGDTLVVGAPYEDSDSPGINGNQGDNGTSAMGAV